MEERKIHRLRWATGESVQVWVVDFGSKSTPLIAQQLREIGLKSCQMGVSQFVTACKMRKLPNLIVLSGGDQSVYDPASPVLPPGLYPRLVRESVVLGICYGAQLMAKLAGGEVRKAKVGEYGVVELRLVEGNLIADYDGGRVVMNHGDEIASLPEGWNLIGSTDACRYALVASEREFAVQFHPEMDHTEGGAALFEYIAYQVADCMSDYRFDPEMYVREAIDWLRGACPSGTVLCGVSGGVDSSVVYKLAEHAYGSRLRGIYIDHGWMREGETDEVRAIFGDAQVSYVDASTLFHERIEAIPYLANGSHCASEGQYFESVRKTMGAAFIDAFVAEARRLGLADASALLQGTNAADIVESDAGLKSHHNVGGLPDRLHLDIIEPLAGLYKMEIRKLAEYLGLPNEIVFRQPFPGPGLALRAWGKLDRSFAAPLSKANRILEEVMRKHVPDPRDRPCQYYVALAPLPTTGLMGDKRVIGYLWLKRFVWSDARESYASLDVRDMRREFTAELDHRLVTEVTMQDGTRFVGCAYVTTGKPPSTTEPH